MARPDSALVKRTDASAVTQLLSMSATNFFPGQLGGKGDYIYTARMKGTDYMITDVQEESPTVKRTYGAKIETDDDAMDTDDIQRRLLNARLTPLTQEGYLSMMIASANKDTFRRILRNEKDLIAKATKDGAERIDNNQFLKYAFTYYSDLSKLKLLISQVRRSLAYAKALPKEQEYSYFYNFHAGYGTGIDDAHQLIDLSFIPVKNKTIATNEKISAEEFIFRIKSQEDFIYYRQLFREKKSITGIPKNNIKVPAMIDVFLGSLDTSNATTDMANTRGEMLAVKVMTTILTKDYELKYCCTDKSGSHGIDQIWGTRGDRDFISKYMIVECKGSKDAREEDSGAGAQMSPRWIMKSLKDIHKSGDRNKRLVEKILTAAAGKASVIATSRKDSENQAPVIPKVHCLTIHAKYDKADVGLKKYSQESYDPEKNAHNYRENIVFKISDRGRLDFSKLVT